MPIKIHTYQSQVNPSFWFVTQTSRVRHLINTYIMDDFGNLQVLDYKKFAVVVTN